MTKYDTHTLDQFITENTSPLLGDQKNVYHCILNYGKYKGVSVLIEALSGTGKNFLKNMLIAKVHMKKNIVFIVASIVIAATLVDGGRTAHSIYCLPLDLT